MTFIDLVQALAIRSIRATPRRQPVSLQKLRAAVEFVETKYGIKDVLARRHSLFVYQSDVYFKVESDLLGVSRGKSFRQYMIEPVLEPYLEELAFDANGFATEWVPLRVFNEDIVLDPSRRFGQPILRKSGLLVTALVDSAAAEGSIHRAAKQHGVKPNAVRAALKFHDWISGIAA